MIEFPSGPVADQLLAAGAGLLAGLLVWLIAHLRATRRIERLAADRDHAHETVDRVTAEAAAASQRAEKQADELDDKREQLARVGAQLEAERAGTRDKLKLLEETREQMTVQFKQLSQEILEEKSKRFTEQNREGMKQILDPLREKIASFEKQVAETYDRESRDRISLFEQVKALQKLNQQVSEDAQNLAVALRGDSKAQGNWGEVILERILEASGLEKGREYDTQVVADGGRARPDAVVHLPEGRDLVIDAKASLTAYVQAVESDDPAQYESLMKEHVASLRRHVQQLAERDYQHIEGIASPDFVLMFVPSEAAYIEAIRRDPRLHEEAIGKHIGLVSPSTLLPTLRTVEYLWRVDRQNRNAQEIATQAGRLYDKFHGFKADLDKLGDRLRLAQESYGEVEKKLSSGRGNLVSRAQRLLELGASASKRLDNGLTERARQDDPDPDTD